ncbi:MAG: ABC transporter ATP-binding protein/permease [Anaeroplasmataceae bacterium]|nr:ABC transporter ATP-binding protein/permease [Anaeroplasmataceae bacterium]
MIKIKNLNKYYNKNKENQIHVINDVTLELPDTGLISFLGPSGSGKTTLLNVIGGLDKAKGTITYNELEIKDYKMRQIDKFRSKEIGYVFQNYNLLLEETVYSNLAIALEMIGIYDAEEQEKRIEYTLKAVGMYKYRKKRAYALSGGQQQRVSIARALIKKTKIIIADEPTGNLDSENTIEVMNILKKISKSSLVLLVTHNEDVANFYSDQVIKLQDGCIKEQYAGGENFSLNTEQNNTIYLKDLNLEEQNGDLLNIKYYSVNEPKSIDLQIVEKNGTYYISSSVKLKLAEDTNVRLIDDHYQALNHEDVAQFEYDTSWYHDSNKNRNSFKRFLGYLAKSFNKIRFAKRRTKFLFTCFVVIGILLAVCMISFSNYIIADDSYINADKNYDVITNDKYLSTYELNNKYYDLIDEGSIGDLVQPINMQGSINYKYNFSESLSYSVDFFTIAYPSEPTFQLLAGKEPLKGELVISKKIADDFIKANYDVYKSYDDVIGLKINGYSQISYDYDMNFTICGVCDNPYIMGYINDEEYIDLYILEQGEYIDDKMDYFARSYDIESKLNTYEIVAGRDIQKSVNKEMLIASTLSDSEKYIGANRIINNEKYTIVGTFVFKDYETTESSYICDIDTSNTIRLLVCCNLYTNYQLVEGKDIESSRDCLVSIYSNYNIGDKIGNLVVVGKYYSDGVTIGKNIIASKEALQIENQVYYSFFWFRTINKQNVQNILPTEFYLTNVYDYYYTPIQEDNQLSLLIFGILSLALLVTISIFIYFIMRSRMIADIYPIGVYRSLGASKGRLYKQFISDIFITITMTSLLGYVITAVVYQMIANGVNSMLNVNVFKSNILFTLLGILVLYVLNFFFGLLPIKLLLHKTPAEIISKYDI